MSILFIVLLFGALVHGIATNKSNKKVVLSNKNSIPTIKPDKGYYPDNSSL